MAEAAVRTTGFPWDKDFPGNGAPTRLDQLADRILSRCRGEGPANCVARCPLRVDARGYIQLTRQGRYQEALQRIRRELPFPGILGYVCTHPCELHCKRIDQDGAIRIRDIKRFLADRESGEPKHILSRKAASGKSVAVVGTGPAGLMAAHDLQRSGHAATLFEREEMIGGCLVHKIPEWRLPRRVVTRDLGIIDALGIEVRTGVELGGEVAFDDLRQEFDAVLLLLGYEGGLRFLRRLGKGGRRTVRETLWADPLTCETEFPGIFAGGEAVSGPSTVIDALAMGRRTAESAHRYLEGRNRREGRESPLPPPLLWTLDVDEAERIRRQRTPVMLQPCNPALSEAVVGLEAERCLDCQCSLCVDQCEFLAAHCDSPKELARTVQAGFQGENDLEMIYSCNLCGLCTTVCPEGLEPGDMLLEARRRAVEQGRGPLSPQHDGTVAYFERGVSPAFSLVLSAPGRSRSKRLFLPGCELPAVGPRQTLRLYDELRRNHPGTGVLLYCCGAPAEALGLERRARETVEQILRRMESVGAEELLTACPDCNAQLRTRLPDVPVRMVWERLAEEWSPPRQSDGSRVALHDPCKTRHDPSLHAAVRKLIEMAGGAVEELEYSGELTRCCGQGGRIGPVDPDLAHRIAQRRSNEVSLPTITYCAGCRRALHGCGTEAAHLVDYLFATDWRQAARAEQPGRVARQINRLRTKWALRRLRPIGAE